ncbi:MAG: hypothetical protein WCX28_06380 [Bacteriovoracaceae bacterium]|nr:hypothetical protein [Bacteroidota bacterium]
MKMLLLFPFILLTSEFSFAQKGDYVFQLGMISTTPVMIVSSTKTYTCSNYGIYIRQEWSRDTLTVNILGIDSRQNCNNVPDKAKEIVEVYGIRDNEFVLRFLSDKRINFFHVEFDDDSFTITPERSDFIRATTN